VAFQYIRKFWAALERGHRFVTHDVWQIGKPGEQIPHGFFIKHIRVAILLFRGIYEETLLLRASALTFATMLFIVPFLVFMFSFIQTFHLGDQVYSSLSRRLDDQLKNVIELLRGEEDDVVVEDDAPPPPDAPAEAEGESRALKVDPFDTAFDWEVPEEPAPLEAIDPFSPEAAGTDPAVVAAEDEERAQLAKLEEQKINDEELWRRLIETLFPGFHRQAVEEAGLDYTDPVSIMVGMAERGATNFQTLGLTGILYVLITVLGLMRNVEWSFNQIWGVSKARNFFRTMSDYIVITLLLPFVAAGVLGITAALETLEVLTPFKAALQVGQFAIVSSTFSLLYFVVPNTKVEVRYAILGGLVAGLAWMLCSYAYVRFNIGLARYTFFFSTFALFPLFLFWIYTSWVIFLFGALLTFAYQHEKTFAMERIADDASYAYKEALAVRAVIDMARSFKEGRSPYSIAEMGEAWNVPTRLVNETIASLVKANLVTECATEPVRYQPARSPEYTRIMDVLRAVREAGQDPSHFREDESYRPIFDGISEFLPEYTSATVAELTNQLEEREKGQEKKKNGEVVALKTRRTAQED